MIVGVLSSGVSPQDKVWVEHVLSESRRQRREKAIWQRPVVGLANVLIQLSAAACSATSYFPSTLDGDSDERPL